MFAFQWSTCISVKIDWVQKFVSRRALWRQCNIASCCTLCRKASAAVGTVQGTVQDSIVMGSLMRVYWHITRMLKVLAVWASVCNRPVYNIVSINAAANKSSVTKSQLAILWQNLYYSFIGNQANRFLSTGQTYYRIECTQKNHWILFINIVQLHVYNINVFPGDQHCWLAPWPSLTEMHQCQYQEHNCSARKNACIRRQLQIAKHIY